MDWLEELYDNLYMELQKEFPEYWFKIQESRWFIKIGRKDISVPFGYISYLGEEEMFGLEIVDLPRIKWECFYFDPSDPNCFLKMYQMIRDRDTL